MSRRNAYYLFHQNPPVPCHLSPVTCHLSPVTCHLSPVTCHLSPVTCHLSPITYHLSPVTFVLSPVTCHLSPLSCHLSTVNCHPVWASSALKILLVCSCADQSSCSWGLLLPKGGANFHQLGPSGPSWSKSVFKIMGKSHYQGQKRTQRLCCAILWQNVTWFFQYFWISENVYKKCLKCNLPNMFCISDERARKARKYKF